MFSRTTIVGTVFVVYSCSGVPPMMQTVPDSLVSETFSGEATSLSLLEHARKGDDEAWSRFVKIYTPMVYTNLRRLGLSESDAADVSQEVFSKVYQKLEKYDSNHPKASFRGWLATVVRNTCYSHYRTDNREIKASGGTDMQQFLQQAPSEFNDSDLHDGDFLQTLSDDALLVKQALTVIKDDFAEDTWKAFWMTAVEERVSSEVAEQLGKTNAAIRKAKQRVMDRLKETLADVLNREDANG